MMSISMIEKTFESFAANADLPLDMGIVDYVGINISESHVDSYEFKAYYAEEFSQSITHPFIDFLLENKMLLYREKVNNEKDGIQRIDISLKNRSNLNILEMFAWLSENTTMFARVRVLVEKLAQMKITEQRDYDYSSLYHVSFVARKGKIEVIKFHFLNRVCQYPDAFHTNIRYDNAYYLEYLSQCNLINFGKVLNFVNLLIMNYGGNLWMTGADYTDDNDYLKYKLYVRDVSDFYVALMSTFLSMDYDENAEILQKIRCVEAWNQHHSELICVGVAIGVDAQDKFIVNFYFQYDEKLFH